MRGEKIFTWGTGYIASGQNYRPLVIGVKTRLTGNLRGGNCGRERILTGRILTGGVPVGAVDDGQLHQLPLLQLVLALALK
jgi:hypothetical protein